MRRTFMKKKFTIGLIVLLSASLFLLGCSTDVDDDPTAEEVAAGALADALGDDATISGTVVTLKNTVALIEDLTVPAGVKLVVPTGKTLTVNGGQVLTVAGTLDVKGDLTVNASGTLNIAGTIAVTGGYTLIEGAKGKLDGKVTIADNAVLTAGKDVRFPGTGTNVVSAGGTVYFDDDSVAFIGDDASATFNLTSGTFTFNGANYILAGAATLNNISADWSADIWLSGDEIKLTINKGAVLTVGTDAAIVMSSCTGLATRPLVGGSAGSGNAPKIVFGTNASYFSYFSKTGTYYYFYNNSGGLIVDKDDDANKLPNNTTFTWDASLADDKGGWKAQ
jgi:hypothetical protein